MGINQKPKRKLDSKSKLEKQKIFTVRPNQEKKSCVKINPSIGLPCPLKQTKHFYCRGTWSFPFILEFLERKTITRFDFFFSFSLVCLSWFFLCFCYCSLVNRDEGSFFIHPRKRNEEWLGPVINWRLTHLCAWETGGLWRILFFSIFSFESDF